jgi:hypothetical protein
MLGKTGKMGVGVGDEFEEFLGNRRGAGRKMREK